MFSDLFSFLHSNPPYMGQEDSEALIDAVVYTMMVDKVIDPDEMEKVEDLSDKLYWKGEGSVEDYVRQSITRALENKNFNTRVKKIQHSCQKNEKNMKIRIFFVVNRVNSGVLNKKQKISKSEIRLSRAHQNPEKTKQHWILATAIRC